MAFYSAVCRILQYLNKRMLNPVFFSVYASSALLMAKFTINFIGTGLLESDSIVSASSSYSYRSSSRVKILTFLGAIFPVLYHAIDGSPSHRIHLQQGLLVTSLSKASKCPLIQPNARPFAVNAWGRKIQFMLTILDFAHLSEVESYTHAM